MAQGLAQKRGSKAALAVLLLAFPHAAGTQSVADYEQACISCLRRGNQCLPPGGTRSYKAERGTHMRSARQAGQSLAGGSALGSPTTADQPATRDGREHGAGSKPKRGVLTHTGLAGMVFCFPA